MATIADLMVKVGVDSKGVDSGVKKTSKSIVKGLGKAAAIGTTALAGMGVAAFGLANKLSAATDEIGKTAQKAGVSSQALEELRFWGDQNAVSATDMDKALGRLNQRIGDGAAGSSKYVDALNSIGVKTQDASGNARDAETVFRESVVALSNVESETQRAAIAAEIYGTKLSRELLPGINAGEAGLESAAAKMEIIGTRTDEQTASAAKFQDSWGFTTTAIKSFLTDAAFPVVDFFNNNLFPVLEGTVLPAIRKVIDAFGEGGLAGGMAAIGDLASDLGPELLESVGGILENILGFITDNVPKIVDFILEQREAFFDAAIKVISALAEALPEIIPKVIEALLHVVTTLVQTLVELAPILLEGALQLLLGLVDAVLMVLPDVIAAIIDLLDVVIKALLEALPMIIEAGIELLLALVMGIVEAIPTLVQTVLELIPMLIETLVGMLPMIIEGGIELILALVFGIIDAIPILIETIIEMVPVIVEALINALPLIIKAGIQLVVGLIKGIIKAIPKIVKLITTGGSPGVIPSIIDALKKSIPRLIRSGIDLLGGLVRGIIKAIPKVMKAAKKVVMRIINFYKKLPGKIGRAISGIARAISAPFRSAFNSVARLWNRSIGSLSFTVPSWVPGLGGRGFSFPKLPLLARGGEITAGGFATVGERGPEDVFLPRGAEVAPLSRRAEMDSMRILIESGGTEMDDLLIKLLRRSIRKKGGNVQVVLGKRGA